MSTKTYFDARPQSVRYLEYSPAGIKSGDRRPSNSV